MALQQLWPVLKRRAWLIILCVVVASATSFGLTRWYLHRVYQGQSIMMVIPNTNSGQSFLTTLVTGQQMVTTFAALTTSHIVVSKAIASLGWNLSASDATKEITASPDTSTNLLTITVRSNSPQNASSLSNAVAESLVSTITKITGQSSLKIVAPATPNPTPISPKPKLDTALASAIGLLVGLGLVIAWESLDDTIHNEDEVIKLFNLPVLGEIPNLPLGTRRRDPLTVPSATSSERTTST